MISATKLKKHNLFFFYSLHCETGVVGPAGVVVVVVVGGGGGRN